jgi:phosphate:Na+ symporter
MVTKLIKGDDTVIDVNVDTLTDELIFEAPVLALESAKLVVYNMGKLTKQMFDGAVEYSFNNNKKTFENGFQIEEMLDTIDQKAHDYLVKIAQHGLDKDASQLQASYVDTIRDFERIGDHCVNLFQFFEHRYENKMVLSKNAHIELTRLYNVVQETIAFTLEAFDTQDKEIAKKVIEREEIIDRLVIRNRKRHIKRLNTNEDSETVDGFYVDILSNIERIGDHCNNIVINILQENYYNEEMDYEY